MSNFQLALREVEPSTPREVYVEVSETTWDDVGGLGKGQNTLTEGVEWPLRFPEIYAHAKVEATSRCVVIWPSGIGQDTDRTRACQSVRGQLSSP